MPDHDPLGKKLKLMPDQPGVYRFLDQKGKILYIGKAKNLSKRVGSYFHSGRGHSYRITKLLQQVEDVSYTVTNSEIEALLLENNLIKTHQPRYNILLKDGKTFPYICIKKERFPRVFPTRNKVADGSLFFGPFPSVTTMKSLLNLIRDLTPLRNCNYQLSEKNIRAGKFRRCLEYQIGNCAGPCEDLVTEESYNAGIEQVKQVLRGNLSPVLNLLQSQMEAAATNYDYEEAENLKKKLENIRRYKERNKVVTGKDSDLEVMTLLSVERLTVVNHFKLRHGAIVQTHAWELRRKNQEEDHEILTASLAQLKAEDENLFPVFISNIELDEKFIPDGLQWSVPQIGEKSHLVKLSLKNCKTLLDEKIYAQNFRKRPSAAELMMLELQKELNLKVLPDHIECFDNSNIQGNQPVASVVVFKGGKPSKKDYRHFKIRTVEGPDDFASMEEIVERRYRRLLKEEAALPKLIVIDGGKGQLSSAVAALKKIGLYGDLPIIGIAKRLEEIYKPADSIPLHLDKKSPALHLIQQVRNEAHRFAITFHRQLRSKGSGQRSKLGSLKGIGPKAEKEIIRKFRSVKKLKLASHEELQTRLGKHRAEIIIKAIGSGEL